jgi:menaquinone-dependent protoporphyrinogen oxidase
VSTLIAFASKHGCAEKCTINLQEKLNERPDIVNLKSKPKVNLDAYRTVIIGGSIHAGKVQKSIQKFCQSNIISLLQKNLGLFICHMEKGKTAQKEFDEAFPEKLRDHAAAIGLFGGEFDFERMNAVERAIVKKVAKIDKSVSKINKEAIQTFINQIQSP